MTREEALNRVKGYLTDIIPIEGYSEVEEIVKALDQEPCEDAVSRQAVLDLVNSDWKHECLETDVASLPSVNPQESILDKIRTEIEQVVNQEKFHDEKWALGLKYALHIIDKYKAESER